MTPGEYVKRYRAEHHLNQRDFANLSGLSAGYISMLENNRNPQTRKPLKISLDTAQKIANATNTDIGSLIQELNDDVVIGLMGKSQIVSTQLHKIPLLGSIRCGEPEYADESFEGYVESGFRCDFALRAKGDSMIGARIHDGDIVFIRKQDTVDDGQIAAVILDDDATLKRIRYLPGNMTMLQAENSQYPPIIIGQEGETRTVRILGLAVAFQARIR